MAMYVPALDNLIKAFLKLPNIGYKTAVRLAFHVLDLSSEEAEAFASAIITAKHDITYCPVCQSISESGAVCPICSDSSRDRSTVCVVEDTRAVMAIEKVREYHGLYHVLHGVISPVDGIGVDDIKIKELVARVAAGDVSEVIIATNPNVEGEATAMYISKILTPFGVTVSRLAYGIPVGADLEYADEVTLFRAIEGRRKM